MGITATLILSFAKKIEVLGRVWKGGHPVRVVRAQAAPPTSGETQGYPTACQNRKTEKRGWKRARRERTGRDPRYEGQSPTMGRSENRNLCQSLIFDQRRIVNRRFLL